MTEDPRRLGAARTSTRSSASTRTPPRTTSRRPTASWRAPTTPTPTPATTAKHEKFKAVAEAYDVVGDAEKRKKYDELRAAGAQRRLPAAASAAGPAAGGFDIDDLLRDQRRRVRRHVRRPLRRHRPPAAAASRRARPVAAPTSRPRRPSASPTPSTASPSALRLTSDAPCPDCQGTGGKPGTKPHICPECEGAGFVVSGRRRRLLASTRPARPAAAASSCTTSPARPATAAAAAPPRARSRPASRPGSRTASGSGCAARARPARSGGPAGDLFVTVKVSPHRLFGRKDDNLTIDVPGLLRRGGARRRRQDPDARRRAGHPQDPGRDAQRPHLPGPRRGRAEEATAPTATCSPPSRSRCPRCSTSRPARRSRPTARPPTGSTLRVEPVRGRPVSRPAIDP